MLLERKPTGKRFGPHVTGYKARRSWTLEPEQVLYSYSYYKLKLISCSDFLSTGVLSLFCAKAGAAKVYAVEAAARTAQVARTVVEKNGFSHVIQVS